MRDRDAPCGHRGDVLADDIDALGGNREPEEVSVLVAPYLRVERGTGSRERRQRAARLNEPIGRLNLLGARLTDANREHAAAAVCLKRGARRGSFQALGERFERAPERAWQE